MSVSRQEVKSLIARSDYAPFSWLYALIYWLGMAYLTYRLKSIKAVHGFYTTGSFALKDLCHGISDVDYFVVIGIEQRDDVVVRSAIDLALKDAICLFPFLGPPSERVQSVVVVDDNGKFDNLNFFYRSQTCSFKKVFARDNFRINKPENVDHLAILSELNILVSSVIKALRLRRDNGYFWKSKLRSLLVLLANQSNPGSVINDLELTDSEKTVLLEYWSKPNHLLFQGHSPATAARAYSLFFKLVDLAISRRGFDSLDEKNVVVNLARNSVFIANQLTHCAPFTKSEYSSGGLVLLDDLPQEFNTVNLDGLSYDEAVSLLTDTRHDQLECVVHINKFALRLTNDDTGITDCYMAPFAFHDLSKSETVTFKEVFLNRLVEEAKVALTELQRELVTSSESSTSTNTSNHGTSGGDSCKNSSNCSLISHSTNSGISTESSTSRGTDSGATDNPALGNRRTRTPYLLLVENDLKMLNAFLSGYRLSKVSKEKIVLFRSIGEVFSDLKFSYPDHSSYLDLLKRYYDYLAHGAPAEIIGMLPSNFFGYTTKFFCAVIFGGQLPHRELLRLKLSISLCICTKDRPTMLASLLNSVIRQTRAPEEVVIIDNSPSEETFFAVQRFVGDLPIKYVRDLRPSIPALRNRAIYESSGQIISFTDDDCVLDPQYIAHVERTFLRSRRIGAVGGVMKHLTSQQFSPTELFHSEYLG
ncbi:MAG: glycosyltransferase family A protein [Candidatus Melainabacteria bacterium]|nr:glycosyltransferase family A protein [Candidatus Melainabacteria bacterium]